MNNDDRSQLVIEEVSDEKDTLDEREGVIKKTKKFRPQRGG